MTEVPRPVVIAAHGTADIAGQQTIEAVAARVRQAMPGRRVEVGFLDVISPTVGDALVLADAPAVAVPLLLAPGYHVDVDLPSVAAQVPHPVQITAPVGPDVELVKATLRRLTEAGWQAGDAVVLGAAGSSSARSAAATAQAVEWLGGLTGSRVVAAFASASPPSPAEAVASLRAEGFSRVALATYLLAPGFFADRMHDAGADMVSAPIGPADELIDIVVSRVLDADRAMVASA